MGVCVCVCLYMSTCVRVCLRVYVERVQPDLEESANHHTGVVLELVGFFLSFFSHSLLSFFLSLFLSRVSYPLLSSSSPTLSSVCVCVCVCVCVLGVECQVGRAVALTGAWASCFAPCL